MDFGGIFKKVWKEARARKQLKFTGVYKVRVLWHPELKRELERSFNYYLLYSNEGLSLADHDITTYDPAQF